MKADWPRLRLRTLGTVTQTLPEIDLNMLLSAILNGEVNLYYLNPPNGFVDFESSASNAFNIRWQVFGEDIPYMCHISIWEDIYGATNKVAAFLVSAASIRHRLEEAQYNLAFQNGTAALNINIDKRNIKLLDSLEKPNLILARRPIDPDDTDEYAELNSEHLINLVQKQHPEKPPFQYLERDLDQISLAELFVSEAELLSNKDFKKRATEQSSENPQADDRASLLAMIWALKDLALKLSPTPNYNQNSVISELVSISDKNGKIRGLSEGKIRAVLGEANRKNKAYKKHKSNEPEDSLTT